jgi:FMN-dependent NADH-azoreductase
MVLFVNSCVRENSRTLELAQSVLEHISGTLEEIRLYPDGPEGLDAEKLHLRDELLATKNYDHPVFSFANQFAAADTIVMAAPYWDLAFPAKMRAYLEEITVSGITFKYSNGIPTGLCKAKSLTYITTSGGPIFDEFGYAYVKTLAQNFYGIRQTKAVRAMNLDVDMISAEELLEKAEISVIE